MRLHRLNSTLYISSDHNLIIYDEISGEDRTVAVPAPNLPPNLTKGQIEVFNKEDRTINSLDISQDGQLIAVSTENRQVVVYDRHLNVKKNFIVNRTASQVLFTASGGVLVADRTGDVFLYSLKEDDEDPTFLLGHLSMILDVAVSECGKYIVTCDRDEKIRVSRFPNTYNIVSYCLGHKEFVLAIKIVKNVLVSASGDGTMRFWNFLKGEQLSVINTNCHVSDTVLLEKLAKEMEKDKVDVVALPVSDMQTYCESKNLFVAVSLHTYEGIQLYKIDLETFKYTYLQHMAFIETPHKFCLTDKLYIFNNFRYAVYELNSGNYTETIAPEFEAFYKKYRHFLKSTDSSWITVLYKRKFHNVQEYLDRKKIRLQINQ